MTLGTLVRYDQAEGIWTIQRDYGNNIFCIGKGVEFCDMVPGYMLTELMGSLIPPMPHEHLRSPAWESFEHAIKLKHPGCVFCGRIRADNVGHHKKPFHLFPELELVESNIIIVCPGDHFVRCHYCNWSLYSREIENEIAMHAQVIQSIVRAT